MPCARRSASWASPVSDLRIAADLTVSERGKVSEVRIVDAKAPWTVIHLFTKVAKLTRFRPSFENGVPVESIVHVNQSYDSEAPSDAMAFPPARIATFHGCHMVANFMEPLDGGPSIAVVQ